MGNPLPIVLSAHLRQIPIIEDYAEEIFRSFTEEITPYMYPKAAEKIEDTLAFIRPSMKQNTAGTNLQMVILDKETGEFLGCCGLHNIHTEAPELGIWIKKSAHGHGYGLEAVTAMIGWAREQLKYDHLIYPVDRRNFASRRIPLANGGILKKEYQEVNQSGTTLEIEEYWIY